MVCGPERGHRPGPAHERPPCGDPVKGSRSWHSRARALTCAAVGALAIEGGHAVVAGGAVEAGSTGTVVDVLAAVLACPAVDAHAVVAAVAVVAGAAVLAGIGHELALVHILSAILACPLRWAAAVVRVHTIHTGASIPTAVSWTVVNVFLAVLAGEACGGPGPCQLSPWGPEACAKALPAPLCWAPASPWLEP